MKGVPHKDLVMDAGRILAIKEGTANKFARKMENRRVRLKELLRHAVLWGGLSDVLSDAL